MTDPRDIVVVFCVDAAFALPLAVALSSAADHLADGRRLCVHILHNDIPPDTQARIERAAPDAVVQWHTLRLADHLADLRGGGGADLPTTSHLNETVYWRLLLPRLLPAADRAIYLDCDILVAGDLAELWDTDLGGKSLAAVPDFVFSTVRLAFNDLTSWADYGVDGDGPYFNGGVQLLDLAAWRERKIAEQTVAFLDEYPVRLLEQDAMNCVCAGDWHRLDLAWNVQLFPIMRPEKFKDTDVAAEVRQRPMLVDDAKILHFTGPKPWWPILRHPLRGRYLRELSASSFQSKTEHVAWRAKLEARRAGAAVGKLVGFGHANR
ncbi:MAG: glycosyltransferase family 8 protein [Planctomycetota bacterium]